MLSKHARALTIGLLVMGCLTLPRATQAQTREYSTLHEVVRHFQVAFVDRPNLKALLLGGLRGLKKAVPSCQVQLLPYPNLFLVKSGSKSLRISKTATQNYEALEEALVKAAKLVRGQAKSKTGLEHAIIREMVADCGDPWSVFLEADLYNRLLDDGSGKNGDVGLLVEPHDAGLRVLDVVPDTPAHKAGIQVGMPVASVAGRPADQINELEALALMRGQIGKPVKLVIDNKPYTLTIAAEPKRNIEVDKPERGVARIHLLNFRPDTGRRVAAVMRKLGQMGKLKGLVLDLRGNPGGLVTEGTAVTGLFINGGKVVSVVSRKHMRTEVEQSPSPGPYRNLPIVLLVDHRSASVSEIVAMALRDHNRAQIVGTKTLGKGTVQVVMELMDGSALKLSNGRYYSPKGTPLYEGIEPDVEVQWDGQGEDLQLKRARMMLGG